MTYYSIDLPDLAPHMHRTARRAMVVYALPCFCTAGVGGVRAAVVWQIRVHIVVWYRVYSTALWHSIA